MDSPLRWATATRVSTLLVLAGFVAVPCPRLDLFRQTVRPKTIALTAKASMFCRLSSYRRIRDCQEPAKMIVLVVSGVIPKAAPLLFDIGTLEEA